MEKSNDDLRMLLTGEISPSDFFPSLKGAPEAPKKKTTSSTPEFTGPIEFRTFAQRNDIRAGGPEKRKRMKKRQRI
jgi:hypothetical protein